MATAKTTTAKKPAAATKKTTTAKKPAAATKKTPTAKKPAAAAKKPATTAKKTTSGTSMKVTATEKKLVELYRGADADTKKAALAILKGEKAQTGGILDTILNNKTIMDTVAGFLK